MRGQIGSSPDGMSIGAWQGRLTHSASPGARWWAGKTVGLALLLFALASSAPGLEAYGPTAAGNPVIDRIGSPAPAPQEGPNQTPNPLIYLDVWIFGGFLLLVMAAVTCRYLWDKLRSRGSAAEEELQPWEDPDDFPFD